MAKTDSTEELRLSLPLLEEAVTLLRLAPPAAWACYLAGTGPFVLGLIAFWSDLCNRPAAQSQPLLWALPLTALHLWMRLWQGRFCAHLAALRNGQPCPAWPRTAWLRAAADQLRFGVPAFLALLPALVITLPYGWVYAFYQNLTATAGAPDAAARAWKAARHTPYQNHALLSWLLLCWLIAFCNVFSVTLILPGFVKLFVPVEWAFTRFPFWFLNTTALCVMLALTYLLTDPLVKAVYVLRAFYGLAQTTGEDLRTDWRRLCPPSRAARILALLALLAAPAALSAPDPDVPDPDIPVAAPAQRFAPPAGTLPAERLDARIDRALRHPRYDWRTPVDFSSRQDSWLNRQLSRLFDTFGRWTRSGFDALRRFRDWLGRLFRIRDRDSDAPSSGLSAEALSGVFTALLLGTAALLLLLLWRSRRPPAAQPAVALAQPALPDVADETVTAEVLPDDEWLRLAEQLRAANDYRKAARAFFLALLACLGRRGLLTLQRSKTNADYLRELRRRTVGHLFDDQPFRHASRLFEAGWYGDHLVTAETLDALRLDVEAYRHD